MTLQVSSSSSNRWITSMFMCISDMIHEKDSRIGDCHRSGETLHDNVIINHTSKHEKDERVPWLCHNIGQYFHAETDSEVQFPGQKQRLLND